MKKLLILFLFFAGGLTFAQTVTIGSGTSVQIYPLGNYYGYERSASLYTAAEATMGGTINKVAWYATVARSTTIPIKIYLKETSSSTLSSVTWASMISGATLVYDANNTSITASAWNEFNLTTTFSYGGSDNLLVLVEANYGGYGTGGSGGTGVRYSSATSLHQYWRADSSPPSGSGTVTANRPNIQITFAPTAALDMGATALVLPSASGCYGSSENVTVRIKNFGTALIDFTSDPCTLSASVSGPNPTTFTDVILNSGSLASGATQDVVVSSSYDMSAAGTYTFDASTTVLGDGTPANDAMPSANRTVVSPVSLPQAVDFTGFTGANLTTVFPNWYEAAGASLPSGTSSAWSNASGWSPANTSAKINLWSTSKQDWIVGPKFTATANTVLKYKIAITGYNVYTAHAQGMQTTDDRVVVKLSTNCGESFFDIFTHDASNTGSITNVLVDQQVNLGSYAGSDVIVAFWATDGPTDDLPDYDFHLDDILIEDEVPMVYSSSAVTQNNTTFTVIGTTNQEVIGIEVVTSGSISPIDITKFRINANGTTNVSDIENAKIFFTGTSPVFATTTQFGLTYSSPTVADFDITDNGSPQTLAAGTNYFWLTFDVKAGATLGNVIDAECTLITVDGSDYTPSPSSVSGSRTIKGPLSGNYTVGSVLFNSVTGKNIYFDKSVNRVLKEAELEISQVESKGNNTNLNQNNKLEESIVRKTNKQLVEVEEVTWVPMENGQVYSGPFAVYKSDHPELSFPEGVEAVYATITAAVADLNALGVSGWVNFLLTDASYSSGETFPITVDITSPYQPTSSNTVTIKPNTSVTSTVAGSSSVAIFKLNGADYIIIDGSNSGGNDRSLTIENTNTSTSSAVVWLASKSVSDGATNNTVKNCIIQGNAPTTTLGCIVSSGSTLGGIAETQNNNNKFENNEIKKAAYGIAAVGPTGNEIGLLISENTIGSTVAGDKIGFNGIAAFQQQSAEISKNIVAGVVSVSSATASGIRVAGTADGIMIKKNNIYDIKNTNSTGWGSNGIQLNSSSTAANVNVENNFISDVASEGYSAAGVGDNGYGIILVTGGGYNIYHNSVNLTTNQSVLTGLPSVINITSGITTASSVDIRNNLFINSQTYGTQRYAIYSGAANTVYSFIDYNNYVTAGANLGYLGSNRLDLTAWQGATLQDANSKSVAVTFAGAPDLHLAGASVGDVNLLGTYLLADDIDGDTRLGSPAGPYMGADEASVPLPVELNTFTAKAKDRQVILNWETKTEVNSSLFGIERMKENTNEWLNVGMVQAAGNSNSPISYSFVDNKLQSGKYSYRLKIVDANGSYRYSDAVETEVGLPREYAISQNYPNPFNPSTRIDYQLPFDSRVTLELYGITGEKIATLINSDLSAGYYTAEVNAGVLNLASGIYIYRMVASGGTNQSFTQVKKLMLTK